LPVPRLEALVCPRRHVLAYVREMLAHERRKERERRLTCC
jgi:hypothetical protein